MTGESWRNGVPSKRKVIKMNKILENFKKTVYFNLLSAPRIIILGEIACAFYQGLGWCGTQSSSLPQLENDPEMDVPGT